MKHLRFLNQYIYKYRFRFLLGVAFVFISNVFGVIPAQVIRHAFDLVKENIHYYKLFNGFDLQSEIYGIFGLALFCFGLLVILLALLKGLFMFFMRQTIIVMSRLIEYDLKNEIYRHYQQLSLSFYKRNKTGDLMSRATEDVSRVRMYLGPAIMYSINLVGLFIIIIATMINVNPKLTLYALLPLPLLSFSIYAVNNIISSRSERIQEQLSALTGIAQEIYSGIRVVKAYVQQIPVLRFFDRENKLYKKKSLELARVEALFFPLMLFLVGLSTIITIYVGGLEVMNGKITAGNIAEFVIYINMLTWPVTSIGWVASIIQRAAASQKRINAFLKVKPEITSTASDSLDIAGKVEFRQVDFTYEDTGIQALNQLSFKLEPGEKLVIIGRTGEGKSTIAQLLTRMYDPTGGEVLLDGKPLRTLDLYELRKNIGYVPQDVFLFSDTIYNNIAFGQTHVTREQVIQAAKNAAIYDDIMELPDQFDTLIGERGVNLSGGQKQRISIARALVFEPALMIFDDCLSAVDARTEKRILHNLNTVLKNKTTLIITHRIFSVMDFDKIVVLQQGKVAEEGDHQMLLHRKGYYFELFEKQKIEQSIAT